MGRKTYEEAKNVGDGEALSRKRKLCVFPSDADRFNGRSSCGSRPGCFLSQLKKKTVWLVGGGKLLHPLLEADLIDEWYVQIAPVLLGTGKRLFEPGEYTTRLQFVDMTQMGELVEIHYQRK